jgi:adenylate kinase family enzyme
MFLERLDTVIAFAVVMLLLSLLITTLVQSVSALLELRGRNLLWGLKRLLPQLDPALRAEAAKLAQQILTHPALTDRDGKRASALRASELVLVLEDLAQHGDLNAETKQALKDLFNETVGRQSPEMAAKAQELLDKFNVAFPDQSQALRQTVEGVLGTTQKMVIRVDAWFDTVMDRTSERFKMLTRYTTIACAIPIALFLNVDSLAILKQLSNDPELRTKLVQMSDGTLRQAEGVFEESGRTVASEAIRAVRDDAAGGDVSAALKTACAADPGACQNGLTGRAAGIDWISGQITDPELQRKVIVAYGTAFDQKAIDHFNQLGASFKDLRAQLDGTELNIISGSPSVPKSLDSLLGRLMSVFFLSLGAPFWYNALRKLSDLRPIVARKVEGEPAKALQ